MGDTASERQGLGGRRREERQRPVAEREHSVRGRPGSSAGQGLLLQGELRERCVAPSARLPSTTFFTPRSLCLCVSRIFFVGTSLYLWAFLVAQKMKLNLGLKNALQSHPTGRLLFDQHRQS